MYRLAMKYVLRLGLMVAFSGPERLYRRSVRRLK